MRLKPVVNAGQRVFYADGFVFCGARADIIRPPNKPHLACGAVFLYNDTNIKFLEGVSATNRKTTGYV
jgi:hypothetical protein